MVYLVYDEEKVSAFINQSGYWVSAIVEQLIGWPTKNVIVYFRNRPVFLRPIEKKSYPAVSIYYKKNDPEVFLEAQSFVLDFLTSLSWVEEKSISVRGWLIGSVPRTTPIDNNVSYLNKFFSLNYLPDPAPGSKERLALALYREALSINHYAYKFLSFFKILNLHQPKNQQEWINSSLSQVVDITAITRRDILLQTVKDVGKYLYKSGRCAIAHASYDKDEPIINPDDPKDFQRLVDDLPLIEELAKLAIKEMGIQTSLKAYEEHLYELDGFKKLFDVDLICKLKEYPLDVIEFPHLPPITIRLRHQTPFKALENLQVSAKPLFEGKVELECYSENNLIQISLTLDFMKEQLIFDPFNGYKVNEIYSKSDAELCADFCSFMMSFWANGELELWDLKQDILLGCKDAFVPSNFDPTDTIRILDDFRQAYMEAAQ